MFKKIVERRVPFSALKPGARFRSYGVTGELLPFDFKIYPHPPFTIWPLEKSCRECGDPVDKFFNATTGGSNIEFHHCVDEYVFGEVEEIADWVYVLIYLVAIVLANLTVAMFGPAVIIINAFLFIGLDLTARDRLHDVWHGRNLWPRMAILIAAGSVLSWLLNQDAGPIALASFAAFAGAAATDAIVYHLLGRYPRWLRINGSNVPSAAVDSLIFPTLAFGSFLWPVVLGQFVAKVAGGFVWSLILSRTEVIE